MMTDVRIERLIPQRSPILMVDELLWIDGDKAQTTFTVKPDCIFMGDDGLIEESGLIEHIAQSASAVAGYVALQSGASEPPIGYIGEVKRFSCLRRPKEGDKLCTLITLGPTVNGVTLITGETFCDGSDVITRTLMKIYVESEIDRGEQIG